MVRSMKPEAAWGAVELGFAEILDLRTGIERRRDGAPPGARPVSLAKHSKSGGAGAIYLCQHPSARRRPCAGGLPRSRAASPRGRRLAFQSKRSTSVAAGWARRIPRERRQQMATPERRGGGIGGISLGGILVIIGIVVALLWSLVIGLIIVLIGLIAFGRLRRGKWH